MNNELSFLVKDIPRDDLQLFLKKTVSNCTVKKVEDKIEIDYSWVDVLDESVPYLDTIIRNPRRFIVSEEDIVPIEKTKKVAEESIKHLAVHTNLIQDVDDEGMVKPIKLLNVFKEETIDLYENRFIYSLITNLYTFVRNQLSYREESASNKEEKSVIYEANTTFNNQNISINLNLTSKNQDEVIDSEEILKSREEKIEHIKEILEDFMASKFMKAMANATPVRSPIRKTNVILKEQNFIKALALWEFLENYQIRKPVLEIHNEEDYSSKEYSNNFDMSYFLNYSILSDTISKNGSLIRTEKSSIEKTVFEYAKKFDVNEKNLKKKLLEELEKASKYKNEQLSNIKICYSQFIDNHQTRVNKAKLLFK